MDINNFTKFPVAYNYAYDCDGREHLIVILKSGWKYSSESEELEALNRDEIEIIYSDKYLGNPECSPLYQENDFSFFKPKCDVIAHAYAYPEKDNILSTLCSLEVVDAFKKELRVFPKRYWTYDHGWKIEQEKPLTKQAIHYSLAYGGVDSKNFQNTQQVDTYIENPIGIGYFSDSTDKDIINQNVAQIVYSDEEITHPRKQYRPASFGPINRNVHSRLSLAGTYDQNWFENIRPFLPEDFNLAYYQSAPDDQRIKYLKGGEIVRLNNLSADGIDQFRIPESNFYLQYTKKGNKSQSLKLNADTLFIEPEFKRFTIVYRATIPIELYKKEITNVEVGTPSRAWVRAKMYGKTYKKLGRLG
jgi:hypothetical protein